MSWGRNYGQSAREGIKTIARGNNPGLFEHPTSGMPRRMRSVIDRERTAALQAATEEYSRLPKAERDKLRRGD